MKDRAILAIVLSALALLIAACITAGGAWMIISHVCSVMFGLLLAALMGASEDD